MSENKQCAKCGGPVVGTIFYTSWGYDQTNAEFFQVVRQTKHSVVVRRIKSTYGDGEDGRPNDRRLYPVRDGWTTDFHLMGNPGTPERLRDEERGYSEKLCRVKDAGQRVCLRIDDVRYAWPYEGGGQYDTYAAGLPGH